MGAKAAASEQAPSCSPRAQACNAAVGALRSAPRPQPASGIGSLRDIWGFSLQQRQQAGGVACVHSACRVASDARRRALARLT